MSSARAVRCRLKCHNERNPRRQLLTVKAEDSGGTAIVRCEEGGDDVKSARPLRPGLHTCYNGRYRRQLPGDRMPIPKAALSSDWSLQPDSTKLDSLVIAHQPRRGEYVPGPCTHRPSSHESHKRCKAYIDVPVFDRGNFLFVLLVYSRKVPGLICWNPFPVVLFQAAPCRKLQFSAVFLHGNIYPCTALIILDNPSYLTVDAVYCTNHLLTAVITGNLFDVFRDFVSSAL